MQGLGVGHRLLRLVLRGPATGGVGVRPRGAVIGVWAPLALVTLRFLQGFAGGGEWGGAVTMVVESSPPSRRGFFGSMPQMGVPLGLVLSTAIYSLLTLWPEEDVNGWG